MGIVNPLHKSAQKKTPTDAGSSAESSGAGAQMPKPRIKDFDGRPIQDRLGDLADALNEE